MVEQKTLDNLKGRSKDEKTNIAGAIAVMVTVVLLFGWGFWFLKKIQRGEEFDVFISSTQDQFNPSGVREAQEEIKKQWEANQEQLRKLRETMTPGETPNTDYGEDPEFGQPVEEEPVF